MEQRGLRGPRWSLLGLSLVATVACGEAEAPKAPPPQTVMVDAVEAKAVTVALESVAEIDGYVNAEIRARVSGFLKAQAYQDGSHVKTGDLLFTIDPSEYQAQVQRAQGDVERAKAASEYAKVQLARQQQLVEMKAVAREIYDQALAATHDSAGQVKAAQAALSQSKIDLSYTQIRSPVAGVAGIALVRVGNLVGKEGPTLLTTVSQIDPMRVRFSLAEAEYLKYAQKYQGLGERSLAWAKREFASLKRQGHTQAGDPGIELLLSDGSVYKHRGVIIAADREIDVQTGTIRIEALFPNPEELLRPGQYGRVRFDRPQAQEKSLVVAEKSLMEIQGTYSVAVVGDDHVVKLRKVDIGPQVGDERVIRAGIKEGEWVIVEGVQKVKEGAKVQPQEVSHKAVLRMLDQNDATRLTDTAPDAPSVPTLAPRTRTESR